MRLKYIKEPDLNLIADLQKGWKINDNGVKIRLVNTLGISNFEYESLEDFNREWVTLKEPLLQGKLRKGLKAWAEYQGLERIKYRKGIDYSVFYFYDKNLGFTIDFEIKTKIFDLDEGEYKLKDLVGE